MTVNWGPSKKSKKVKSIQRNSNMLGWCNRSIASNDLVAVRPTATAAAAIAAATVAAADAAAAVDVCTTATIPREGRKRGKAVRRKTRMAKPTTNDDGDNDNENDGRGTPLLNSLAVTSPRPPPTPSHPPCLTFPCSVFRAQLHCSVCALEVNKHPQRLLYDRDPRSVAARCSCCSHSCCKCRCCRKPPSSAQTPLSQRSQPHQLPSSN